MDNIIILKSDILVPKVLFCDLTRDLRRLIIKTSVVTKNPASKIISLYRHNMSSEEIYYNIGLIDVPNSNTPIIIYEGNRNNIFKTYYDSSELLDYASGLGYLYVVKLLIDDGIDVNKKYFFHHGTALLRSVTSGHFDVSKCLIDHGANINGKIILEAVKNENYNILELLLSSNWINPDNKCILTAAYDGNLNILKLLLNNNFDINYQNSIGSTALMLASQEGHFNVVQYLVDNKADVNLRDSDGLNAKDHASGHRGYGKIINILDQA